MRYGITIEKTMRVYREFDAASDEEAMTKADEMYNSKEIEDVINDGSEDWDYALVDLDSGFDIVGWK